MQLTDGMILDGLWDPYKDVHMGTCADRCAQQYKISRAEQDAHAIESHRRARSAHDAGFSGRVSLVPPRAPGTLPCLGSCSSLWIASHSLEYPKPLLASGFVLLKQAL